MSFTLTNYAQTGCKSCSVHSGWYSAEKKVIGNVIKEVKRLSILYETVKVYATGHSLGASLANLSAVDLAVNGYDVRLYNFGQPRVGN